MQSGSAAIYNPRMMSDVGSIKYPPYNDEISHGCVFLPTDS